MTVPYWVQDTVFYQIFPDRFANGDPENDPPNVQPWGSPPTSRNFMGGDLRGIIQNFDYLLDLGISGLYLNPIFLSPSNHRYSTVDYFTIDPKLGDMHDFKALLEIAHHNGVRVILDGVFNHCGRGFFAFADLLENQELSPYRDWFHVKKFPVDAYSPGEAKDYLGWWKFKSLPKFNTDNPDVRRYLFKVARYWIEAGADGWRLDVPNEIDDDEFWGEFRRNVKSVNREAYLVGEIWKENPRWVGDEHFDGLMNYPVRDLFLELASLDSIDMVKAAGKLEQLLEIYPRQNAYAMYVPLGSHDTARIYTKLEGDQAKVKLAFLFQFAYPGAPAIFYGDEIGLAGGGDPECRVAFPWDRQQWDTKLRAWVKMLISYRKRIPALRRGNYRTVLADNRRRCLGFARTLGYESILVLLNFGPTRRHLHVPVEGLAWDDGRIVRDLLGREEYIVSGDSLTVTLQPWSGVWVS